MTERLSSDPDRFQEISDNIGRVRSIIKQAAERSGRSEEEITLVAVTKTMPAEDVQAALDCGICVFGENRVQELLSKLPLLDMQGKRADVIGHLQTNKVRSIIDTVGLIQSVDSLHLAQTIDREAQRVGRVVDVLCEVNIGGEASKSGTSAEALPGLLEKMENLSHIRVLGLMTVPPVSADKETTRQYFRQMRKLFIDIGQKKTDNSNISMNLLSMGMSSDFDIAIEEGSNMVRVGTAIFGRRSYGGQVAAL